MGALPGASPGVRPHRRKRFEESAEHGAKKGADARRDQPDRDRAAIGAELVEHIQSLRRYALALTRHPADADDLVQETLKRALLYLGGKQPIDNLRAYLVTMLHNVRRDALIRRARAGSEVDVDEVELVSSAASQTDRVACRQVLDAIERLPEKQRQVLALVGVEEMSYREAADTLGLPIGTVMSRLNRARAALRALLEPDMEKPDLDKPNDATSDGEGGSGAPP